MDAFYEIVAGADVVDVFILDEDITKVLAYVTLEFIGSGVADLDSKPIAWLFESLGTKGEDLEREAKTGFTYRVTIDKLRHNDFQRVGRK